jgi:hypothetical protein
MAVEEAVPLRCPVALLLGKHFPLATATLYSEIVPPQSRPPFTGVFVICARLAQW